MILSPKDALDKKYVTSPDFLIDKDSQLQQHGIDVRLRDVQRINKEHVLLLPGKVRPALLQVKKDRKGYFLLWPGTAYSVTCYERVKVPDNTAAYLYGRSTLGRYGIFARSSLYDSGYDNVIGLTIYPFCMFKVKPGERIAQIVFYVADNHSAYNGQYQGSTIIGETPGIEE